LYIVLILKIKLSQVCDFNDMETAIVG